MRHAECPREADVLSLVGAGGAAPGGEELMMHAEQCEGCRDLLTVAAALRDAGTLAAHDVHVPAAGQVWWRAAVRARLENTRAAARPITWAHGAAGASIVGVTLGVGGLVWPSVKQAAAWAAGRFEMLDAETLGAIAVLADAARVSLPIAIAVAACVVLAPLAVYAALSDRGK